MFCIPVAAILADLIGLFEAGFIGKVLKMHDPNVETSNASNSCTGPTEKHTMACDTNTTTRDAKNAARWYWVEVASLISGRECDVTKPCGIMRLGLGFNVQENTMVEDPLLVLGKVSRTIADDSQHGVRKLGTVLKENTQNGAELGMERWLSTEDVDTVPRPIEVQ